MSGPPENLIFEYLRRFDTKIDRVIDELNDIKGRMTHVEEGLAGVLRRLNRMKVPLDRIEKRFDLVDSSH